MTTAELAPPVSGSAFIDRLLEQTPPVASQPRRGQNYNYPQRLFLKPDGTVVRLQGDPQNLAYYQDKGYRLLRDQPGRDGVSEVRQYLDVELPAILKQQREKAALINAIRRTADSNRDLKLEDTFDDYSIEEIREYLADIKERTGHDIRVVLPRRAQAREDARDAVLLRGVETSESRSLEGFQNALERSREQTIQGTGYDPIEQSRKRATRPGGNT